MGLPYPIFSSVELFGLLIVFSLSYSISKLIWGSEYGETFCLKTASHRL